ncbi:MAG: TonB-dependent receptor plug domain-containing protein [Crocinitomicaceae bacterium]|nr:TonB-dependent receptor plug domain-containing protein [Crocinitomicaceae bacterium]
MLKIQRLLLLFSLVLSGVSSAQQAVVSGQVMDKREKFISRTEIEDLNASPSKVETDRKGKFELIYQIGDTARINFIGSDLPIKTFIVTGDTILPTIKYLTQVIIQVDGTARREDPFEIDKLPTLDLHKGAGINVEKYLSLTTAATSNNELTNNYNVRGGNYDENLVYVNGFNVYRPFLTRSGQQEGMSFINTSLVKSIQFSAGGFDARYGDKLSSVLDITYKKPDSLKGSLVASLLGIETHIEQAVTPRFNYLVGARYRSNGYLLNSLPTKGAYNPVFWDAQFVTNYAITENLNWSVLGHFSSNNYRFAPQTQETDFGTANEAYSFRVYFEGQEQTIFTTMTGGTSLNWVPNDKTKLDLYATVFNTDEKEYFDILGQYFINELETDPNAEEYGDSIAVLGIGSFQSHARNRLKATIINVYHDGSRELFKGHKNKERTRFQDHSLKWGVNFQMDDFYDVLSEWEVIDSAGYSLPQNPNSLELSEVIKGKLDLQSQRYTSYLQLNSLWKNSVRDTIVTVTKKLKNENNRKYKKSFTDTVSISSSKWALRLGTRAGYTTSNKEFYLTPRASVTYSPRAYMVQDGKVVKRQVNLRFSTGMYYQPPFYREFRTFAGQLNLDVKAQKSFHFVTGTDVYFNMWDREVPFKFTVEAFYKHLWDVNPYEVDNVRTRYYANNDAVAYAYGLDMNIHGQFVEGIESLFKLGFLQTKEDILSDNYKEYYNVDGEKIIFGFSEDQNVVDSATIYPGYIPRPSDQWLTFGALIQDRMPKYESFNVSVGVQFGAPLPYGPPDFHRYKDTLRLRSYFRVDIGMAYDFLYKAKEKGKDNFFTRNFDDATVSFEVFNLLGVNNVLSKQWVQDVNGEYYAIPNYLTQRRFNLKLLLRF